MPVLINYDFSGITVTPEQVAYTYRLYSGDITTLDEYVPGADAVEPVTRYRRDTLLDTITVTLSKAEVVSLLRTYKKNKIANDVEAGNLELVWERWSDFIIPYFNTLLQNDASLRGLTPITEQT